jgi:hypothetical protein
LAITPLCIVYVLASLIIPAKASAVEPWRSYYFQIRRRLFGMSVAYVISVVACTVFLLGHPILHFRRVIPLSLLLLSTVGFVSDNPRTHALLVCLIAGLIRAPPVMPAAKQPAEADRPPRASNFRVTFWPRNQAVPATRS